MLSDEMIAFGVGACFCNVFWVLIHVFMKYSVFAFGYQKQKKHKQKQAEKAHKNATLWRKLYLVELVNNASGHLLLVGACFLYNAVSITLGPIAIVVCYILAYINEFSGFYAALIFSVPLCWTALCAIVFTVPMILFIPEVRRQYSK